MDFSNNFFLSAVPNTVLDIMVWVVFSLLLFDFINRITDDRLYSKIENSKYTQPFWATLMGSIPGCGGAILISNLYSKGKVSLGSLTACFIATFGDAAFVILASDPFIFLWLLAVSFVVGMFVGYLIDFTYLGKFLNKIIEKNKEKAGAEIAEEQKNLPTKPKESSIFILWDRTIIPSVFMFLFVLVAPATVSSLFFPLDLAGNAIPPAGTAWVAYYQVAYWISLFIVIFFISYYFLRKMIMKNYDDRNALDAYLTEHNCGKEIQDVNKKYSKKKTSSVEYMKIQHKTFLDSIFILTWVFFGLLIFNLVYYPFEESWNLFLGLASGFMGILVAVGIGMIPGCGPQIAFASLYLNPGAGLNPGEGAVSTSAITANSINQDGDAGFPLLAVDRRTFTVIRILNFIPALLTGLILLPMENHGLLDFLIR